MNRSVALHNIQVSCPLISKYLINTYRHPPRLFISGGSEILSMEGTTQRDPLAMPWYSLNTVLTIQQLRHLVPEVHQVWLADDVSAEGKMSSLHKWYDHLKVEAVKNGYYVNSSKSWLIVKSAEIESQAKPIFGNTVNITLEGKQHLGAVIGSQEYTDEYCAHKVDNWLSVLRNLCEFSLTQPQAVYMAYTKAYKSKFKYFMLTVEHFEKNLTPIEEILNDSFLPGLFGTDGSFQPHMRDLFALPQREGGLGVTSLTHDAPHQFSGSTLIINHTLKL